MKKLRYLAFTLSLVISAGAVHASDAGSGKTTPSLEGSTDGEMRSSRGSSESGVQSFDDIAKNVLRLELSLDALKERTDKSRGRRNIEMDDDHISGLNFLRDNPARRVVPESPYGTIEALYNSIIAMEYVGKDKDEVIRPLLAKLEVILSQLPDVSALSVGENDPTPSAAATRLEINNTMRAVNSFLGTALSADDRFSTWANAVRDFFAREENEDRRFEFTNTLLSLRSSRVKENSSKAYGNEGFNFNRLFCYHLARAAGYAHENLIKDILSELKDCIQGSGTIVEGFNRTLVFDIRPLLLQVRLLENTQVLKEYFDSLLSLAHHTRFGVHDSISGEIYRGYSEHDGIYKELQRVYNSLQLHIMRLRIEEKIRPALEAELENNPELLRLAEMRQAEERRQQEEARFASMAVEARNAARIVKLESLIATKMNELEVIAQTHTAPGGVLDSANAEMIQVRDDFNAKLQASELTNRAVIDLFTAAGEGITAVFNKARQAIEAPARQRFADIATAAFRTDAERERRIAVAREEALTKEALRKRASTNAATDADASRAKRLETFGLVAERDWKAGGSKVSADQEASIADRAQNAYVNAIVSAITSQPKPLNSKIQRAGRINAILTELKDVLLKVNADRYALIVSEVVAAKLDPVVIIDGVESKINTGREELFTRLQEIMRTRIN